MGRRGGPGFCSMIGSYFLLLFFFPTCTRCDCSNNNGRLCGGTVVAISLGETTIHFFFNAFFATVSPQPPRKKPLNEWLSWRNLIGWRNRKYIEIDKARAAKGVMLLRARARGGGVI